MTIKQLREIIKDTDENAYVLLWPNEYEETSLLGSVETTWFAAFDEEGNILDVAHEGIVSGESEEEVSERLEMLNLDKEKYTLLPAIMLYQR